jgi:hypothetical protein
MSRVPERSINSSHEASASFIIAACAARLAS